MIALANTFESNRYYPKHITLANPGAGNNWSYTVSNGHVFIPMNIRFKFTTDATVATRELTIQIVQGISTVFTLQHYTGITASRVFIGNYGAASGYTMAAERNNAFNASFTPGFWMSATHQIGIQTLNMQAADAYTEIHLFGKEYIDPYLLN